MSDHLPVMMLPSKTVRRKDYRSRLTNGQTKWETFKKCIRENVCVIDPIINTAYQLDEEIDLLTMKMQEEA